MKSVTWLMVVGAIVLGAALLVPISLAANEGIGAVDIGSSGDRSIRDFNLDDQANDVSVDSQENQSGEQGEVNVDTQENQVGDQGEMSVDSQENQSGEQGEVNEDF